ncbi:MAG TPA: hypothetical protein VGN97_14530 [Mesorhizobium sp.]|jgi:hypothetical protein|nr:hypothetical protein [Mesorhizobium sp.]
MSGGRKRRREEKPVDRLDKELLRLKAEIAQAPARPDLMELTRRLRAALENKAKKAAG